MTDNDQAAADDLEATDAGSGWLAVHCKSLRQCPTMGALSDEPSYPAHLGQDSRILLMSHPWKGAQRGMQVLESLIHQLGVSGDWATCLTGLEQRRTWSTHLPLTLIWRVCWPEQKGVMTPS